MARNTVEMEAGRGTIRARAAIVTVSTGVLAAEKIKFFPDLPKRQADAIAKLSLGSYDHIALELKGNPLQLRNDDLVFEKSTGPRTAALLANASGTPLALVEVGGKFGAELSRAGEAAMTDFALGWLSDLFGADVKKAVGKTHASALGAPTSSRSGAFSGRGRERAGRGRKILMEYRVRDRKHFFAGEAIHETLWGHGRRRLGSGERAPPMRRSSCGAGAEHSVASACVSPRRGQPRLAWRANGWPSGYAPCLPQHSPMLAGVSGL